MQPKLFTLIILFLSSFTLSLAHSQGLRYDLSTEEILQLETEQTVPLIKLNNYYLIHTNPIHPIVYNGEILMPLKQISKLFTGQSANLTGLGQASAKTSYNHEKKTATFNYVPVNQDMGKLCHMEFSSKNYDLERNIYPGLWFENNKEVETPTPSPFKETKKTSEIIIDLSVNKQQHQNEVLVPLIRVLKCIGIDNIPQGDTNSLVVESTRILFDGNIFLYSRHFGYFLDKVDKSSTYPVLGEYVIVEDNPLINLSYIDISSGNNNIGAFEQAIFQLTSHLPTNSNTSANPEDYLTIYTSLGSSVSAYGVGTPALPCDGGCDYTPICRPINDTTYECYKEVSTLPHRYGDYTLLRINNTTK